MSQITCVAMTDGIALPGGNVGGAVRVGDTVRRPTGPWTPAVHDLLGFLHRARLDLIPDVLGFDDQGREVLSFLPGHGFDVNTSTVSDSLLRQGAGWLRRFHDIVRNYRPAGEVTWRNATARLGPDEIICHHDPAAYNWVVDGDRLTGIVDWDMAGPGRPIDDVAMMAWNSVPLFGQMSPSDMARRLTTMSEQYGSLTAAEILAHVDVRMTSAAERIAAGQRRGDQGMLNLAKIGEPAATLERLEELRRRVPQIVSELRSG